MDGEETGYDIRMFAFDGDILISIYYLGILEFIVPVVPFVKWLEDNDQKSFFVDPPTIDKPDDNPHFDTGIPAIEQSLIRIKLNK